MELIATDSCLILQPVHKGESSLFIQRANGAVSVRPSWDPAQQENPECLGLVMGLVGVLRVHPECVPRLVLVQSCYRVCELPGRGLDPHGIYKVTRVVCVPISDLVESIRQLALKPCPKHQPMLMNPPEECPGQRVELPPEEVPAPPPVAPTSKTLSKLGGSIKLFASDAVKSTAGNAAALASQVKVPWTSNTKPPLPSITFSSPNINRMIERFEKRVVDEFCKLFNESDSFYFSFSGDLTNTLQRQMQPDYPVDLPLWQRVDDRFFFNKHLIQDVIALNDPRADTFICPFIQGFVELMDSPLHFSEANQLYGQSILVPKADISLPEYFSIALISRRSRHRAGTRYKRRGVDEDGHVANYVETEQILLYHHYALSFVMTRGSVPVYWSQPGYKYRPPPILDRSDDEDQAAFQAHFDREFKIYGSPINCVSLVERNGREKVIADAYLNQALNLDNPDLGFVAFDFHEYCRGMHFENVSILIKNLEPQLKALRYCWVDNHGMVCGQQGAFRINCIDCLDRTNVVQTAIARMVLEVQLTKLGVVPPEMPLPLETRLKFQGIWANNGDVISRQYAGTNALKSDFTRTGERNISGMMKDGMNSASRYYLNQFRDAYRQATIDLLVGHSDSEELLVKNLESESAAESRHKMEVDNSATAEHVRILIEDCKKLLIPDQETVVGAWGLISNDPVSGDFNQEDLDVIFLLTKDAYYVALYEDETDKVTQYQKVLLSNVEKIEFGVPEQGFNLIGRNNTRSEHSLRIFYKMPSEDISAKESGFFHMFRSTNLRFFNNMAIVVRSPEEKVESLKIIVDSISVAIEIAGFSVDTWFGKLDKKKTRIPDLYSNYNVLPLEDVPVFKSVGSRALQNMTSQISKLNPMSRFRFSTKRNNEEPEEVLPQGNVTQLENSANDIRSSSPTFTTPSEVVEPINQSLPEQSLRPDDEGLTANLPTQLSSANQESMFKPDSLISTPRGKISHEINSFGANLASKKNPPTPVSPRKCLAPPRVEDGSAVIGEPGSLNPDLTSPPIKPELEEAIAKSRTKVLIVCDNVR
ncbi:hypothetical protein TCAL_01419 [Tigriopus californicus]|uniref:SAC domain-containing protein n=1 Tax=Tigriopus californicus TaxID=6832 RepID=A0A553NUC1_TIGCA|nr:phosphatidylinositide phosphatase SAC2-like [Tigriopus californicus]TRY69034.1 hypothetical protein TCAL_01419 [Tigriopus californicus]|eukprot:TCALIF_01419-PA protein Name:"Similar to inpp5f Phosphatidylinositide phosphatase SAC2 (Danio rerio)" AED:0.04 eAED:0.04 QI:369/1/1/1/1/1/8/402/1045